MSSSKLVIATRLHLGNASAPPATEKIKGWVDNLHGMILAAATKDLDVEGVIAVDATPKLEDYDFVQVLREHTTKEYLSESRIHILPVTPWGKFVPALNALTLYAHETVQADQILFVSAEVSASPDSIHHLHHYCQGGHDDGSYVLVAGAALSGHFHTSKDGVSTSVVLNGRTCPWNTMAMWNLSKLILTGFVSVSDIGSWAGIEECAAVAVHQNLFPGAKAILVRLPGVEWQVTFDDEERRKWHERKMNSKLERAQTQLELLGLVGKARVDHL